MLKFHYENDNNLFSETLQNWAGRYIHTYISRKDNNFEDNVYTTKGLNYCYKVYLTFKFNIYTYVVVCGVDTLNLHICFLICTYINYICVTMYIIHSELEC